MKRKSFFRVAASLTAMTVGLLACGAPASAPVVEGDAPPQPIPTQSLPVEPIASPQPAIPERRMLTLEFPPRIRAGDSDLIRLTIEVDERGNITPTAEHEGSITRGEVIEIPNLYETHQVIAEVRFDMAGVEVRPEGLVSESLSPGNAVNFYWSVQAKDIGVYRGTIWLYLRFVDIVSGDESRRTVSAQPVEIEAVNFLGLSAGWARLAGIFGSIAGTVIGFPFFEEIVKFLARKRGRQGQ